MLYGRVIEVISEDGARTAVVATGDELRSYRVSGREQPSRGDIIAFEAPGGALEVRERLGGVQEGSFRSEGDAMRWRRPGNGPSRMRLLWERQRIVQAVRGYLYDASFLEIQAPLLLRGACPDAHLQTIPGGDGYLTTSTEYQIKRLVCGGFERVFTISQNFRGAETGNRHNPEFTMLEWARAFEDLAAIERDAQAMIEGAFRAIHPEGHSLVCSGATVRICDTPWERVTVREALNRELGIDLGPDFSLDRMQGEVVRAGIDVPASCLTDRVELFSALMSRVQDGFGSRMPVFVREWPAFLTSSAALVTGNPAVTDRSELFIAGIEVGDAFASLQDYPLHLAHFERELSRRRARGGQQVPIDDAYLEAIRQGLPPGAGMAIGLDRLALVLLGQDDIRRVLAFAWDEL